MTADMDLSIIIVNWNSTGYARECVRSIYEHTSGIPFQIIVVDNASPANDVDDLTKEFQDIIAVKSPVNLGFAGANNLGVTMATGKFILFLNPDTKLIQPALEVMVEAMTSRPRAGAVGCRLLNEDLSVQTSCIQTFPTILNQALDADQLRNRFPTSALWGTAALAFATSEPVPVEVVSGACLLMRRDVFVEVGRFDEDYFMYAEDLDLCRRAMRAGYRNYYIGSTSLIHYGGRSSTPNSATIMKWCSMLHYCEKHRGATYALLFRLVMAIVATGRLLILAAGGAVRMPASGCTPGYSAADKWKAILATLLHGAGERQKC